jgi:hypothetical protein
LLRHWHLIGWIICALFATGAASATFRGNMQQIPALQRNWAAQEEINAGVNLRVTRLEDAAVQTSKTLDEIKSESKEQSRDIKIILSRLPSRGSPP